jgi:hypothetical protein
MEAVGNCPYCGEAITIWIDSGGGSHQRYVEDCLVCCRPIDIELLPGDDEEVPYMQLHRDDD